MLRTIARSSAAARIVLAPRAPVAARAAARAASAAAGARFTKDHEYARLEGKVATCGITDFAQTQLGDVVYVSLPQVGSKFKKG
jgi:hypothetical protein